MVLASDKPVSVVAVVLTEPTLPCPFELYGLPEASVIDMPEIGMVKKLFIYFTRNKLV